METTSVQRGSETSSVTHPVERGGQTYGGLRAHTSFGGAFSLPPSLPLRINRRKHDMAVAVAAWRAFRAATQKLDGWIRISQSDRDWRGGLRLTDDDGRRRKK